VVLERIAFSNLGVKYSFKFIAEMNSLADPTRPICLNLSEIEVDKKEEE
jgi:hypothetical protein